MAAMPTDVDMRTRLAGLIGLLESSAAMDAYIAGPSHSELSKRSQGAG